MKQWKSKDKPNPMRSHEKPYARILTVDKSYIKNHPVNISIHLLKGGCNTCFRGGETVVAGFQLTSKQISELISELTRFI